MTKKGAYLNAFIFLCIVYNLFTLAQFPQMPATCEYVIFCGTFGALYCSGIVAEAGNALGHDFAFAASALVFGYDSGMVRTVWANLFL